MAKTASIIEALNQQSKQQSAPPQTKPTPPPLPPQPPSRISQRKPIPGTEKSSGLTNKGQTRGFGSLQQPGNCGLEIYFIVIKLSQQSKGECGFVEVFFNLFPLHI